MDGEPPTRNRRPLVCAAVAAGALCAGWLLPAAHTDRGDDAENGGGIPAVEHVHGEADQDH